MKERYGVITFQGQPLTLASHELTVGMAAPDFEAVDNDLGLFRFSSQRGKICVITSVPSLDTPVCDFETHRFNDEASKMGPDVAILTVSMDLPFAQKRWCGANGVERLKTYSDHRTADFGMAYGVLIKEWRLLARAVFVVDGAGILRYVELVKELENQPNYDEVLATVKQLEEGAVASPPIHSVSSTALGGHDSPEPASGS